MNIKLVRTLTNLYIIGDVELKNEYLVVKKPYSFIPTQDGIGMLPMDSEILGKELNEIKIKIDDVLYSEAPTEQIQKAYQEARSGLIL